KEFLWLPDTLTDISTHKHLTGSMTSN
ncbi:orthodenticle, partial [Danaus plexippus plexippus]